MTDPERANRRHRQSKWIAPPLGALHPDQASPLPTLAHAHWEPNDV